MSNQQEERHLKIINVSQERKDKGDEQEQLAIQQKEQGGGGQE